MSYDQKNAKAVLTAQALGGIVGISCGCLLGMLPLLLGRLPPDEYPPPSVPSGFADGLAANKCN